jgi:hypothetical protein
MSNSMRDDYFSFMSEKCDSKISRQGAAAAGRAARPAMRSDTIDFVEESQIEVTEQFVSDAMIQQLFKLWVKD